MACPCPPPPHLPLEDKDGPEGAWPAMLAECCRRAGEGARKTPWRLSLDAAAGVRSRDRWEVSLDWGEAVGGV